MAGVAHHDDGFIWDGWVNHQFALDLSLLRCVAHFTRFLLYAHLLIFLAASVLWSMTQRFVDHSPSLSITLSLSLWQCVRECGLFLYNPHILAESFMQLLATERGRCRATKCPIMRIRPVALTNKFEIAFKEQLAIRLIMQPTATAFHDTLKNCFVTLMNRKVGKGTESAESLQIRQSERQRPVILAPFCCALKTYTHIPYIYV